MWGYNINNTFIKIENKRIISFLNKTQSFMTSLNNDKIDNLVSSVKNRKKNLRTYNQDIDLIAEYNYYDNLGLYIKMKVITNLYKYMSHKRNIAYSTSYYKLDKLFLATHTNARNLLNDIDNHKLDYHTRSNLFFERKIIKNSKNAILHFVKKYNDIRYFIINVLYKKNIPTEIIKFIHDYIYIDSMSIHHIIRQI